VVSALALPLYAYDIPNNEWYNFGEIGLAVPMGEIRYQEAMNWPVPPNTWSTKSTALSAIFAPLENITEELQLSTASTSAGLRAPPGLSPQVTVLCSLHHYRTTNTLRTGSPS
jgi:hypothetical protein